MTADKLLKNLERPKGRIDMVLDTDAYNEIDDQFAIAYMLSSPERLNVKAIYAAPFFNEKSAGPKDGMEKSYGEILNILALADKSDMNGIVHKGSDRYLPDEKTPVISPAAEHLAELAAGYSPENPLYVGAIGAITNVASAILINPAIIESIVIVWLGGHAHHWKDTVEFNMYQDIAAARVIFGCGAPVVQIPCMGVVSAFTVSEPELEKWLVGKNKVSDYLARNTIEAANSYAKGKPWTRVIWDVTVIAWLLDADVFAESYEKSPIPEYDGYYAFDPERHFIKYIRYVNRNNLLEDLISKLTGDVL